jgi:hypothetical protein
VAPGCQYPRRHSFATLINNLILLGLLERTGQTEKPEEAGGETGIGQGYLAPELGATGARVRGLRRVGRPYWLCGFGCP